MAKRELLPEQKALVHHFWKAACSPQGALFKAERLCHLLAKHIQECQARGIPPDKKRIEQDVVDASDAILAFKGCIDDAYLTVPPKEIAAIEAEVKTWPAVESGRHYMAYPSPMAAADKQPEISSGVEQPAKPEDVKAQ